MLKTEEQMDLRARITRGESIRGLSRATGLSRNTVRKYIRNDAPITKRKTGPKRAEKLDPFKPYIVARLETATPERVPVAGLFREIKERGYLGGLTRVKQFVRGRKRPYSSAELIEPLPSRGMSLTLGRC